MMRATRTLVLGALAACLLAAGDADARTERLRWTHPNPGGVDRYTLHWGLSSGNYTKTQDVVAPPVDGEGAFFADVTVPDASTRFFAVTATTNGLRSAFSNERERGPAAPPPPPPPPPGANAAVVQFALWNADTDVIVDDDFQLGELIFLADTPCTTIEAVVNNYLDATSAPGSVRFAVDGNVPQCNDLDVTHDDEPPYELGAEDGPGDFACSAVLAIPGDHSLSVTPFDGDGCTGTEGTTRMITFTVIEPAPPPDPLGQPGRPTLVPF